MLLAIAGLCGLALVASPGEASAAAKWLSPVNLSAPLRDADDADVAMDAGGGTVAIWEREGATPFNRTVQVAFRSAGGVFEAPVTLSSPSQDPALEMSPSGEAIAAWWHSTSGGYVLEASVRPPGGGFGPAQEIAGLAPGFSGSPPAIQLSMNESGAAVIAWERREPDPEPDPDPQSIQASTRPAGGAFSSPDTISEEPDFSAEPDVAIDGSGDAIVVWTVLDEEAFVGQYSTGTVTGGFSSPPSDLPMGRDNALVPDVAMSSAGNTVVVFQGTDIPEEDDEEEPLPVAPPTIEAVSGQVPGAFSGPAELSEDEQSSFEPQLSIGSGGFAVATWVQETAGTDLIVMAATRSGVGPFSSPLELSAEGADSSSPDVAVNAAGAATIAWRRGSPATVQASVRPSNGSFGAAIDLSTSGQDALFPAVAMDTEGDSVAVWRRFDGANWIAQAAGYDASPPVIRSLLVPATGTVGVPVSFSAEPFDVWSISSTVFDFGDGTGQAGESVSHAYSAPGVYKVTVTATDQAGDTAAASGTIAIAPAYDFEIGKRKRNKKLGTMRLTITVPGPGGVASSGKGVKRQRKRAAGAGSVKVTIAAKGKALKRLKEKGKARVRVTISFTPDGGDHSTGKRIVLVLIKR